jgi:hypothetical protein
MTDCVRYFHGGKRGLAVGGYILPPSETKVPSTPDCGEMGGLHRKDRVYVTTALVDAQFYAAASHDPIVYEVEPQGILEDDPDCLGPGRIYACEKAKNYRVTQGSRQIDQEGAKENAASQKPETIHSTKVASADRH